MIAAKTVLMKELCSIKSGKSDTIDAVEDGDYAFFDRSKKIKRSNKFLFDCEALIIAGEGAEFLPKHYSGKFDLHQRAYALHNFNSELDVKYLYYYLHHVKDYFPRVAVGATVKSLRLRHFEELPIVLYPLSTQKKIVQKLESILSVIEKAKTIAEANAKNAEALFQSYLTEIFDVNTNLVKLKDCCLIKPSKSEAKKISDTTIVSFMPMEALPINQKYAIPNQIRELKDVSGSYTYFSEGDVLLAKITPCFENGKLGIAKNLTNGIGFGSSEYVVFRTYEDLLNEWLYYFLNRNAFRKDGAMKMSGAVGHKRVTKEFIENSEIPLIAMNEQKRYLSKINELFAQTSVISRACNMKIKNLNSLTQSILKQAFDGELVKE